MGRRVLGDVVDEEDGGAVAVVAADDGLEALLAGGVPDGHLDVEVLVDLDDLGGELDPCVSV